MKVTRLQLRRVIREALLTENEGADEVADELFRRHGDHAATELDDLEEVIAGIANEMGFEDYEIPDIVDDVINQI